MGIFKPKIYKHQGEAVALSLAWKIQDGPSGIKTSCPGMFAIGINWFITNQERTVESELREHGIYKSSSNQKKQIGKLAIKFHKLQIYTSSDAEKTSSDWIWILSDFRK